MASFFELGTAKAATGKSYGKPFTFFTEVPPWNGQNRLLKRRGWGLKLVLLDPNHRPLLLQWFETFGPHDVFLTHYLTRLSPMDSSIVII